MLSRPGDLRRLGIQDDLGTAFRNRPIFSRNAVADKPAMKFPDDRSQSRPNRRAFLRHAGGAALAGLAAQRAFADEAPLDALIGDTDRSEFGQTFDQASRTIHMPKATAPTLSPSTAETTEHAIETYDGIVTRGGWPTVPKVDELRLGMRHPSVVDLRSRLSVSGDLDPSAAGNDIYNSYVEEAVRRFQARHGLTIDGILREVDARCAERSGGDAARSAQGQYRAAQDADHQSRPALRRRQYSRPPASRRSKTTSRYRGTPRSSASPTGRRPTSTQNHPDQFQSVLDRAGVDRAQGPHSENAGPAGISDRQSHPHFRRHAPRIAAVADQLVFGRRDELHVQAGSRQLQFARLDPHQFPQPLRRLYARHAAEESVRRRFPLSFLGLHAGAERAPTGRLAAWTTPRAGRPTRSTK